MTGRFFLVAGFVVLAGCAAPKGKAPVESRPVGAATSSQAAPQAPAKKPAAPTSAASAAAPAPAYQEPTPTGFYRVKRGDTLIGIALEHGVDWRELAASNDISNPNIIEVGRLLRISPARPAAPAPSVAAVPVSPVGPTPADTSAPPGSQAAAVPSAGAAQVRPLEPSPPAAAPGGSAQAPAEMASAAPPPASTAAPAPAGLQWAWPANGQLITNFAEGGSKGVAIAGAPGEAIFAAENGRVIYSGSGLRGYGNLVIVKHDQDFTTAYAHNRAILVKEGQTVRRGQKIAELGMSDADRPMLHFEVRRSGKPVDPIGFLPIR
ncbi:MAG: LysM peptidoglycan-binding domain-containing protein [Betaproteobacteria bacterium]|nr:LysM peptidoglycan-binding domain-containing protein [Betaproteobacteria bacterium]